MTHLLRKNMSAMEVFLSVQNTKSNGPFDCPPGTTNHLVSCVKALTNPNPPKLRLNDSLGKGALSGNSSILWLWKIKSNISNNYFVVLGYNFIKS